MNRATVSVKIAWHVEHSVRFVGQHERRVRAQGQGQAQSAIAWQVEQFRSIASAYDFSPRTYDSYFGCVDRTHFWYENSTGAKPDPNCGW